MKTTPKAERPMQRSQAIVALFVLVAGLVFWLASGIAHAAPPAGTVIGNQATATYNDAGGAPRTSTSNLVQVTVSQLKSFTLTADGARTASSGQQVYYPHTLTNIGNGTDTYTLNALTTGGAFAHTGLAYYADANGDGVPDSATPITGTVNLAAGGVFRFVVGGIVPGTATNGQQGTIIVSVSDTQVTTTTNTDTTTVANSAVAVTKSMTPPSGPSPSAGALTVTLAYTNAGSVAATNLQLRDVIPAGMTYVPNSGRWSVTGGATVLTDADATDNQSGIVYDFNVTLANRVTATIATVPAGFSGTLTFQVTVNAGLVPQTINNTATYVTTTQTTPQSTNTASYQVVQSANVVANGSTTDSTQGAGEDVVIASAGAGSTITFSNTVWNLGNNADSFDITLSGSTFPVGSVITLLQADGATSLLDTNGNGTPDTGNIPVFAAGCPAPYVADAANQRCGYRYFVRVQLPAVSGTGPFQVVNTATSRFDNTRTDTVIDRVTTVQASGVDLTNNAPLPGGAGAGATGTTVITTQNLTPSTSATTFTRFQLYVNNTGLTADSYDLTVAGVPAGWTVVFRADGGAANCSTVGAVMANTGPINGGANRLVCAEVTVPATTSNQVAAGTYNLDFTATSASTATSTDVKRDAVAIQPVHSVTLTPNNVQQTFAGSSVVYTHILQNFGNVTENITFGAGFLTDTRQPQGWSSVAYLDTNANGVFDPGVDDVTPLPGGSPFALNANATRAVFVRVFAPATATAANPPNVTTLTATYNAGGSTVSATDTTSVTDGLLMVKEQRTIDCTGAPAGTFTQGGIPAGPGTAPGQCIQYRITSTNSTAAGITNVVISDAIPANTRQRNSCGAPAATVGAVTAPGDGNTGTISVNVGPLASGANTVLTFCVRIDP